MLECMKNRRSIRKYTDQDIPESLLNELLEVATRASNTGNMHCIVSWLPRPCEQGETGSGSF